MDCINCKDKYQLTCPIHYELALEDIPMKSKDTQTKEECKNCGRKTNYSREYCANAHCEYVTSTKENKKYNCEPCLDTGCHLCPTPPEERDWRKELDKILWNNLDLSENPTDTLRPMRKELQNDLADFISQEIEKGQEEVIQKLMNHKFNTWKAETAFMDGKVKLSTIEERTVLDYKELVDFIKSLGIDITNKEE